MSEMRGHWTSAPAAQRIVKWLQAGNTGTYSFMAEKVAFCHPNVARHWIKQMKQEDAIHVCGTEERAGMGGPKPRIWAWGSAKDAKKPASKSKAERCKESRRRIHKLFGNEIARRIFTAAAYKHERVVIQGITVYQRGVGINRAAAALVAP